MLEYPQYTRPAVWRGREVPGVLLSGNHAKIDEWRRTQSILVTKERRPDMFNRESLTKDDIKMLKKQGINTDML